MKKTFLFIFFIEFSQAFCCSLHEGEGIVSSRQSFYTYYMGISSLWKSFGEYKETNAEKYVIFLHEVALEAVRIKKVALDKHPFLPHSYKDQLAISREIFLDLIQKNNLSEAINNIRKAKKALDVFFARVFLALEKKQQDPADPLSAVFLAGRVAPQERLQTVIATLGKEMSESHGDNPLPALLLPSLLLRFLAEGEDVTCVPGTFPTGSSP